MTSYTEVFGGENIKPSDLSYRAIALTANQTLVWPLNAPPSANIAAAKMDVTPDAAGRTITLPNANQASTGEDLYFFNDSSDAFSVVDAAGGAVVTVAAGDAWFVYLTGNATAAGTWQAIQQGAGTSSADAAALAGYGVKAITTTLNQSHPVTETAIGLTLDATDRAQVVVSTGGSITFALTAAATLGDDWFTLVRNGGTGTLTLNPNGAETIDDAATKVLQIGQSCFIVCDGAEFFTIGLGESTTGNVTAATVAGGGAAGDQTLTATELAAQVQQYTGTLTGSRNYDYGAITGYWMIYNNMTLGGFTATWRVNNLDAGVTSAAVPAGASALIYADGVNMRLAGALALTGDVTMTEGVGSRAATIANGAVTFVKMQDIATNSLIGRDTAGSGDPENILLNATLEMDGSGNLQRAALTGDVTVSAGSNATTIANSAVTLAKMADMATDSLIGRDTAGTGVPQVIGLNSTLSMDGANSLQRAALTGDVTASAGSNTTSIAALTTDGDMLYRSTTNIRLPIGTTNYGLVSNGTLPVWETIVRPSVTTTLTVGYAATPYNGGTVSSGTYTPDEANGSKQYITNGGAFTLAPPTNNTNIEVDVLNNGSAGAITTSGFTKVTGAFATTNTYKYRCFISKNQQGSLLQIVALQ
jgi:hypothetical protein